RRSYDNDSALNNPAQEALLLNTGSERVVCEYISSWVKKFLIWGGEFRNCLRHYDVMTDVVGGIVNFRITGRLTI
ncbi:MAG: hypothetical protein FWC30_01150, partial [Candidatus Bathyarchaeota archaeon]|nr:hypothetical protein [Candidatus Termiticorpusculum sp.]